MCLASKFYYCLYCVFYSFCENIERITSENYVPSDRDILSARMPTTGIIETNFQYHGFMLQWVLYYTLHIHKGIDMSVWPFNLNIYYTYYVNMIWHVWFLFHKPRSILKERLQSAFFKISFSDHKWFKRHFMANRGLILQVKATVKACP